MLFPAFPPNDHHRPAHHDTSSEMTIWPQKTPPRQDDFRNANTMQSSTTPPMKNMSKMFYKTKMCLKFKSGACPYGNSCTFAHGVEDLREPPLGWKNIMNVQGEECNINQNSVDMQRIIQLKICRNFYNVGRCPYGDRCTFLHHHPDSVLGERPAFGVETNPVVAGMGTKIVNHLEQFGGSPAKVGLEAIQKPSLPKTKLCNMWEMSGESPDGDKCHHAHVISELQKYDGNDNEVENRHKHLVPPIQPNKRQASSLPIQQQPLKQRHLPCVLPNKIRLIYADWIE